MKKETIVNDVKTAGVAIVATMTMSACNNVKSKPLSEKEKAVAVHRTDSVANQNAQYRLAHTMTDFCNENITKLRAKNKSIVKKASQQYVQKQIKEAQIRYILSDIIKNEQITGSFEIDDDGFYMVDDVVNNDTCVNADFIRDNYRWVNDLLLYLNDKYTDRQLLKTEFFKILNDKKLEREFTRNTDNIEHFKVTLDMASKNANSIYDKVWEKNVADIKQSRQR